MDDPRAFQEPLKAERVQSRKKAGVPGWKLTQDAKALTRTYELSDFRAAIAFVNRVAEVAEEAGHHPDIHVRYNRVRLVLTTHSAGEVTGKDYELAARIDGAT